MVETFTIPQFLVLGFAAVAAGMINAIAGGGTLISFPALIAVGIPPVAANVTNTVALVPGYLGATFAQVKDLNGQKQRLRLLLPASVAGGLVGGLLLLNTSEKLFSELVPYLILLAAGLLAVQDTVRKWVVQRTAASGSLTANATGAIGLVLLAAIYGGYFGAGLSVIVLAVLGLVIEDNLTRLNALKQSIAFAANVAAAIFFVFSGPVVWSAAGFMAIGATIGGVLGGKLASRIKPQTLRAVVVAIGVMIAIIYLVR